MNDLQRKILWINPVTFDMFPHQASNLELLRSMEKRGYASILITVRSKKKPIQIENSRVRIISVPLRFVRFLSSFMFAIGLFIFLPICILVSAPQFLIVNQPDLSIFGLIPNLLFSKLRGIKFVLDIRSTPVEVSGFRGFQQKRLFSISVLVAKKLFDGMTIITSLMREEICNAFGIDPCKVGIWSSGVNTALFSPENCTSDGVGLRRKLGLSGKFVVFYHGAFSVTRGLKETVESIKVLGSEYPNVVVFLLGTGSMVSTLKHIVHDEGLQESVIVHDPVDYAEVPKFIEMSDVCIVPLPDHPYWRSQCPLKLLEYLAMEKAVIVTDIPAHRSVIGDEKCGIYISSVTPSEIAKAIVYAYHNKEELAEWGKSGRAIIDKKYTWEKVAEDLENYLLSINKKIG
jgi:glycosyltransferase involved in cell wall biosynthesis